MTSKVDRSEAARKAAATRKRNAALRELAEQKLQPAMLQPGEAVKARPELDYGVREDEVPARQDVDAVLKFLPVFESPGFVFGTMVEPKDQIPFASLSSEARAFLQSIYDHKWIFQFEWSDWQPEAESYFADPSRLDHADLATIRRLLTLHARKDRFCDGHLLSMFEGGHITAILKRLRALSLVEQEDRKGDGATIECVRPREQRTAMPISPERLWEIGRLARLLQRRDADLDNVGDLANAVPELLEEVTRLRASLRAVLSEARAALGDEPESSKFGWGDGDVTFRKE
jgi:hypothetical protein